MTNQALLYAQMQGQGMGHMLPDPSEYGRQAAAKKAKAEKWAGRVSGLLFGGAMLLWGRSSVTFTNSAGQTVAANTVPVNQLVLAVLSQNDSIQTSQIARETIKPLFEDVCGWVAGLFYPDDEEAGMMHRMLTGNQGRYNNGQSLAQLQNSGAPLAQVQAAAAQLAQTLQPLPFPQGKLVHEAGSSNYYWVDVINRSLRPVQIPLAAWGPNWQSSAITVAAGGLAPYSANIAAGIPVVGVN